MSDMHPNGNPLYICRAEHSVGNSGKRAGYNVKPNENECQVGYGGQKTYPASDFDCLWEPLKTCG